MLAIIGIVGALLLVGGAYFKGYSGGTSHTEAKWASVAELCRSIKNEKPDDCAAAVRTQLGNLETCKTANASLDAQFSAFRTMHNDAIKRANDEYNRLRREKGEREKVIAPDLASLAMERFNLLVAAKGKGLTCAEYDALLLDEMKRKQRDFGAAKEAGEGPKIVEPAKAKP